MPIPIEVLEAEMLGLPPAQRSQLLDRLVASLDLNPEWEAAWIRECEDRLAALDRGEMQTHDFDEVMAEARARLKRV